MNKESATIALGNSNVIVQIYYIQVPLLLGPWQRQTGQLPPLEKRLYNLTCNASQNDFAITSFRVHIGTGFILINDRGMEITRSIQMVSSWDGS